MYKIQFKSARSDFRILNPFNNFAEEVHEVEVQKDPLLGDTSIYNPYLKDKARFFFGENDPELIKKLAGESNEYLFHIAGKYIYDSVPGNMFH